MKVAIQGIKASFHDVASREFFHEKFDLVECSSFNELFHSLKTGKANFAMMAIENALAGTILPNYALMEKYNFKIIGEVYLKIEMSLLALPGQKLEDIRLVQSHPMALLQCQDFLSTLKDVKIVEHADTAESALEIKTKNLVNQASIANKLAADTYGLEVLKQGIESNQLNFTRFLVLAKDGLNAPVKSNKTTISFEVEHVPGSLVKILNIFEKNNLNMTKIQSLPIIGRPYHYAFYVDLEWTKDSDFEVGMKEFQKTALRHTHFGNYVTGKKPF
ncbi:MAG: prephenate dehydratase [Bdellovibrionales bacterium]|nr:prephenate dehydratase [Bdellovibrionales bacterium]